MGKYLIVLQIIRGKEMGGVGWAGLILHKKTKESKFKFVRLRSGSLVWSQYLANCQSTVARKKGSVEKGSS